MLNAPGAQCDDALPARRAQCDRSLADLGCGYLDLYLMEWPVAWLPGTEDVDHDVKLTETW